MTSRPPRACIEGICRGIWQSTSRERCCCPGDGCGHRPFARPPDVPLHHTPQRLVPRRDCRRVLPLRAWADRRAVRSAVADDGAVASRQTREAVQRYASASSAEPVRALSRWHDNHPAIRIPRPGLSLLICDLCARTHARTQCFEPANVIIGVAENHCIVLVLVLVPVQATISSPVTSAGGKRKKLLEVFNLFLKVVLTASTASLRLD